MSATKRSAPLRILHLEDDPNDTEILSMILADENIPCEVHRVDARKDFEAELEKRTWNIVISDFSLPSFDGLKALSLVREKFGDLPFILFSGTIGEETAVECLKRGATDYVLKQRPARLVSAVRAIYNTADERERSRKFQDELQQILSTMETSARRGADMLRQVLAFARGVEGKKAPVQLKALLREMEKIARDAFPKTIRVRTDVAKDLWPVLGYPTQLYQVLMNLCINARDAMPNGGQLSLHAENIQLDGAASQIHREAAPGPYLRLTVSDTGMGMPPEIQEKIFQPFFTTKELSGGTGLGLSTSLDIIKNHGGFITVKSQVGQGSQFSVYFPALTASAQTEAEPQLSRLPSGNGEMILLVDDEVSICEITKAALQNYGYRVVVANSGPEAVTIYAGKRNEIKLAITDTGMPFMDGHATSMALKKINPALKIIMASGGEMGKNTTETPSDPNISAFAPKPYTVENLLTIVHNVLQGKT